MRLRPVGAWTATGLVVAVAIRVSNAFRYPIGQGFDAPENWRYIERLCRSWELPAPDAIWASAHPPLFYYLSAAIIRALGLPEKQLAYELLRLVGAAIGLGGVALAVALVRRVDPDDSLRARIAAALLLFLPVHLYMSAMLSEEILASSLAALTLVGVCWDRARVASAAAGAGRAAALGAVAGLALLTKLTGLLVIAAGAGSYLLDAARPGPRRKGALRRVAVFTAAALIVGGWYYARNLVSYGYLYPHGLETHEIMFTMPPGQRHLGDYLRFPSATFSDPRATQPELLRSVWGTTYASVWFDAHRHFLRVDDTGVTRAGLILGLLGILPTLAFLRGLALGARRALADASGPDAPLLLLTALTLTGYVLFSWQNPWFAVLKGSFLLGLAVPFAFYASESLSRWLRAPPVFAGAVVVNLCALVVASSVTFTQGLVFVKDDRPGVRWENDPRRKQPAARPDAGVGSQQPEGGRAPARDVGGAP